MSTLSSATCETCDWHASGTTAWAEADTHVAETGHSVRRAGGDPTDRPKPFTQPHQGDGA